ncbi:MAG: heavy metal translocating P-type ATPase [Myxococcota bacterium]|jgi:Cu2+-exporting ATPase|nr:heavy metal translocating P-type ATPase [Myxococcota bacterium]
MSSASAAGSEARADEQACFHCGEPVAGDDAVFSMVAEQRRGFCCHGCLAATELIHGLGLDAYYERRESAAAEALTRTNAKAEALARYDDPALQRRFVTWDDDGHCTATLSIGGMRCAACSWLIEERLARLDGVLRANVGLASGRALVEWDPSRVELSEVLAAIGALGYRAFPYEPDLAEAMLKSERRASLRRLGVSGLGTMQVMMFSVALYVGAFGDLEAAHRHLLQVASACVATPVLFYAGWPFLAAAWRDVRLWRIGSDVPIALALVTAYGASVLATVQGQGEVYFDSVCMFIFFITLGRTIERSLRTRAELRVRNLVGRVPQAARRVEGGGVYDVPVADLAPGDVVKVETGERVPADGVLLSGVGEVSEALLTGEPTPLTKQAGDALLAGSEVLDGSLRLRVERTGAASTLQQIASLLDRAQLEKPPIAVLAGRVARIFVSAVIAAAVAVGLAWWWIDPTQVIPVVVAVLIATCPCALSLATPSALAAATHGLASRGFLITRGHALEALAGVSRVVLDKTGTLTAETPVLVDVQLVSTKLTRGEALRLAQRLEHRSNHPIARALRDLEGADVDRSDPGLQAVDAFARSEPGMGVEGEVDGRRLRLGRPEWAAGSGASTPKGAPELAGSVPMTSILLADEREALAWFVFEMPLRPGAEAMVGDLGVLGLQSSLLSGDPSQAGVDSVARRLAIEDAVGNASPEEKLARIETFEASGDHVLAVGDGVNDAPLLGRASVSVAMGSGSDLARLRADAVLLDDRLGTIPLALRWARRTRRVVKQNFTWAVVYNLCALPLAAMGVLAPWQAAIGMSLSSLLVVGNSLRLRSDSSRELAGSEESWARSTS